MIKQMKKILISFFSVGLMFLSIPVYAQTIENRIAGNSRYETAIEISKDGWQVSENVVIATGRDFPDALCAAPLAKKLDAPILLTDKETLSEELRSEIIRLKVKNAYIIGGQGVISTNLETQLKNMGIECKRLCGENRYDTSLEVAKELGDYNEVVIATGSNFPDALSIAPIAAQKNMPIILSLQSHLPETVELYLKNKNISKFYVIGGQGAISENVARELLNSERLYGNDRFSTNIAILNKFSSELDLGSVYIATGEDFPDALSGSAIAVKTSSPLILVSNNLVDETKQYLSDNFFNITKLNILGGQGVISSSTASIVKECVDYGFVQSQLDNVAANDSVSINTEQDLYNAVKNAVIKGEDTIKIITNNDALYDEYLNIVGKVIDDYADYTDYIDSFWVSHSYVKLNYSISKDLLNQRRVECNEAARRIVTSIIKKGMTELQKERAIHDYIVNNSKYDYVNYLNDTIPEDSYSSYGVLVKGVGVCSSYAKAMLKLSRLVGIECYYVTGTSNGEPHAWNILKIDGKYYHVDATFDDPIVNGGKINILSNEYFNVSDKFIEKDHSWDRNKYPACLN